MEKNISNSNEKIAQEVEETCAYINSMYYLAMCLKSKKLNKLLDNFENFEETFPKISKDQWGLYSDNKSLAELLFINDYNGWLIEIVVLERDRFKTDNKNRKVTRRKFVYCHSFDEIVPKMFEYSKDVLEEDIIKFKRDTNAK
ncbi:hypothetical protein [Flavobacterium sp. F52]|uniref:hypothetical protein n=1 Tax=Flavobacterium sp. F52 TaxID=1202532 RepID=UPI000272DFC1|nr:hypothetical protein [Flavobacterium sp. F52]EJG02265.1 hypothetical protein FF52_06280 [Flavobacterium sp. F52]